MKREDKKLTENIITEEYKRVLDSIFCNIIILNMEGRLLYFNQPAKRLFLSMGEKLSEKLNDHLNDFWNAISQEIDPLSGKGRYSINMKGRTIICNLTPFTTDGIRKGTIFLLHESMNPNCVMQELDVTMGLLQEINIFVENSHDGFLVTDNTGAVIRVNSAFENAFCVKRQNIVGRNVQELIDDGIYDHSAVLQVLQTGKPATVSLFKENQRLIATGTPVFNLQDGISSIVVNIRDMTELNELQLHLEHQKKVSEGYERELVYIQNRQGEEVIVHSKEMQIVMDTAKSISQVDCTVLITGESGTGKEVLVNYIHQTSSRKDKPLMKINCGAIPPALFESELFGYEAGAFTGARKNGKAGFFELADKGTIFLDEIGELDLNLQVKLLRVIQERKITRIGGSKTVNIDVRIIAATNQDLWKKVQNETFRQDLYYRLNVINIELPPLRERRDDIIPLSVHFLKKFNELYGKHKEMTMELGRKLRMLDWPGNIRELENLIENMVVLVKEDFLTEKNLPIRYRKIWDDPCRAQIQVDGIMPLKKAVDQMEKQLIINAREKYKTTTEMARALDVDQSTISRKMRKLLD